MALNAGNRLVTRRVACKVFPIVSVVIEVDSGPTAKRVRREFRVALRKTVKGIRMADLALLIAEQLQIAGRSLMFLVASGALDAAVWRTKNGPGDRDGQAGTSGSGFPRMLC